MAEIAVASPSRSAVFWAWLSFVAWTTAIILLINCLFPWSYPSCVNDDGFARWASGFPLPYIQHAGVPSFTADVMPHILVLNLALLAALAYRFRKPTVRWLSRAAPIFTALIAVPGVLLALLALFVSLMELGALGLMEVRFVTSISSLHDSYWDYRPLLSNWWHPGC